MTWTKKIVCRVIFDHSQTDLSLFCTMPKVAGGHGHEEYLNQLDFPTDLFIDS